MTIRSMLAVALLAACAPAQETSTSTTAQAAQASSGTQPGGPGLSLEAALKSPRRSEDNRARDAARHPRETLEFFGLQEDMRVLELWPGRGWYTEVIAPVVASHGSLTAAITDPEGGEYRGKLATEYRAWLVENADWLGSVGTVILSPPDYTNLGEDAYDLVVTFRSTHNWIDDGVAKEVYAAAYAALAPGGVFGVVQHRAADGADPVESAKKGYVSEAYVIEVATQVGFELDERSEINANPKDTKEYPDGVWTLPPGLRGPAETRGTAAAIGESDRMTLRFRKPK